MWRERRWNFVARWRGGAGKWHRKPAWHSAPCAAGDLSLTETAIGVPGAFILSVQVASLRRIPIRFSVAVFFHLARIQSPNPTPSESLNHQMMPRTPGTGQWRQPSLLPRPGSAPGTNGRVRPDQRRVRKDEAPAQLGRNLALPLEWISGVAPPLQCMRAMPSPVCPGHFNNHSRTAFCVCNRQGGRG
jgi:hypothetical protein